MKSKVTKIHPEGATVTRADGSADNIGDEVDSEEALAIMVARASTGGALSFGVIGFSCAVRERLAPPDVDVPLDAENAASLTALLESPRPAPVRVIAGTLEGGPFGAESVTVVITPKTPPALAIGDTATPSRASAPVGRVPRAIPPVLKIE